MQVFSNTITPSVPDEVIVRLTQVFKNKGYALVPYSKDVFHVQTIDDDSTTSQDLLIIKFEMAEVKHHQTRYKAIYIGSLTKWFGYRNRRLQRLLVRSMVDICKELEYLCLIGEEAIHTQEISGEFLKELGFIETGLLDLHLGSFKARGVQVCGFN